MSEAARRDRALAAAHQATESAAELLRFAREGADLNGTFGEVEVVEKLLDAAKMAIECLPEDENSQRYSDIYGDIMHEIQGWI
ncbi:hypothetical protein GR238_36455 [Rhizobium leguminosarum]|nr:hypothetical protein [Rhizobium ruizarguesonis]